VVDEEPLVLHVIQRTLEPLGSTVLTARTGDRALAVAEERGPALDLVLADLHLTDMSGRDVGRVLGQYRPRLPVGVMTDWGDELPSAPTFPVLTKPFTPAMLEEFVGRLLEPRTLERRQSMAGDLPALWARAQAAVQYSRRLTDAVRTARQARWAVLAQTGQLRAAARELRTLR
jgi:CheY-like chemotaxis protein